MTPTIHSPSLASPSLDRPSLHCPSLDRSPRAPNVRQVAVTAFSTA